MSDIAIKVGGLGKKYLIGHNVERANTLRDQIVQSAATIRRNMTRTFQGKQILTGAEVEEFWALKDVDFEIPKGDVVGIVGRNGAGKSTLLKVLSRITDPTTGQAKIHGRVASLLEVGTGFHPELTGRENIFLNGAILGMSRAEIRSKMDEIVAFSGVEKFLDTPVKRYSSGMSVRLAFSVAAHLEPEILIVDEVLAVGDAEFQRKSLGKMEQVANEGRTVIIVSHNQGSLRSLCKSGILLQKGQLVMTGTIDEVLTRYSGETNISSSAITDDGKHGFAFTDFRLDSALGTIRSAVSGTPCEMVVGYRADVESTPEITLGIGVLDAFGNRLLHLSSGDFDQVLSTSPEGEIRIALDRLPLAAGRYLINFTVNLDGNRTGARFHNVPGAAVIEVEQGDFYGTEVTGEFRQMGPVLVNHRWSQ
ncbi:ABC transporter ATP-binding protein [uncultured Pelagimonas sp.]|uniref:ABC transporter ATP-binding protein n=1 Tax=uncultured Pelagimonas sp. TaxID=1618102 RepID=UPI00262B7CE7|nr:ABC transporter ATP-binding protein [uncultured Pelagimonas sp.]